MYIEEPLRNPPLPQPTPSPPHTTHKQFIYLLYRQQFTNKWHSEIIFKNQKLPLWEI